MFYFFRKCPAFNDPRTVVETFSSIRKRTAARLFDGSSRNGHPETKRAVACRQIFAADCFASSVKSFNGRVL